MKRVGLRRVALRRVALSEEGSAEEGRAEEGRAGREVCPLHHNNTILPTYSQRVGMWGGERPAI